MKIAAVLDICVILISCAVHGQNCCVSDLEISVSPKSYFEQDSGATYTAMYPYAVKVKQTIDIGGVSTVSDGWMFDGETMRIPLSPTMPDYVSIEYYYQSDFNFWNYYESLLFFQPQIYGWQSWYFSAPDMYWGKVEFRQCSDALLFCGERKCGTRTDDHDLSFYALDPQYYDRFTVGSGKVSVECLLNKGVCRATVCDTVTRDTINMFFPGDRVDSIGIERKLGRVQEMLERIGDIFPRTDSMRITVADAYLFQTDSHGGKYYWGHSMMCDNGNRFIAIDTTFWHTQGLAHELIHAFNTVVPDKTDKEYAFFAESMTEYLAVCVAYSEPVQRDKVFRDKVSIGGCVKEKSVFSLTDNSVYTATDSGESAAYVIYNRVPYEIHRFAVAVGEDEFLAVMRIFYGNVKASGRCRFGDLETVVLEQGIDEALWLDFKSRL